ncbi:hypothetical protein ACVWY2_002482 [Bradyrhizobium sp. JR6.1]
MVDHQQDRAAVRKEDVVDLVTGARQDRILFERDSLKFRFQEVQIRRRQCREKAITSSAGNAHLRERHQWSHSLLTRTQDQKQIPND